jgi:hypothetical protein
MKGSQHGDLIAERRPWLRNRGRHRRKGPVPRLIGHVAAALAVALAAPAR